LQVELEEQEGENVDGNNVNEEVDNGEEPGDDEDFQPGYEQAAVAEEQVAQAEKGEPEGRRGKKRKVEGQRRSLIQRVKVSYAEEENNYESDSNAEETEDFDEEKRDDDSQKGGAKKGTTGRKAYACPEPGCNKVFYHTAHLSIHGRSKHEYPRLPCKVDECHDTFTTCSARLYHMRAKHGQYSPYNCKMGGCGKAYYNKTLLDDHGRSAHGHAKLVCGVEGCTSSFSSYYGLIRHKRTYHR
jgi:hypothetical protein